jgi:hypothetical protein
MMIANGRLIAGWEDGDAICPPYPPRPHFWHLGEEVEVDPELAREIGELARFLVAEADRFEKLAASAVAEAGLKRRASRAS